jgi:hypothetical protein
MPEELYVEKMVQLTSFMDFNGTHPNYAEHTKVHVQKDLFNSVDSLCRNIFSVLNVKNEHFIYYSITFFQSKLVSNEITIFFDCSLMADG